MTQPNGEPNPFQEFEKWDGSGRPDYYPDEPTGEIHQVPPIEIDPEDDKEENSNDS